MNLATNVVIKGSMHKNLQSYGDMHFNHALLALLGGGVLDLMLCWSTASRYQDKEACTALNHLPVLHSCYTYLALHSATLGMDGDMQISMFAAMLVLYTVQNKEPEN